ncbi:hypothetical protein TMatcc_007868 [Talaromyces marneffei ATCC 18224]|nr:hypothetical protein EYB25_004129 [Talaromyces marneffei]
MIENALPIGGTTNKAKDGKKFLENSILPVCLVLVIYKPSDSSQSSDTLHHPILFNYRGICVSNKSKDPIMMKLSSLLFFALPAAAAHIHARAAHGVIDTNPFNYTGLGGPLNWYGLNKTANEACAKGMRQSPINIDTHTIEYAATGSVNFNISNVASAKFENSGFGLEVLMTNGSLVVNNITYYLDNFHFHTPSEHRVDEEYFPMECHFGFVSDDYKIAVVGFFMEISRFGYTTPLLDSVFARLDDITKPGTFTKTGPLDFSGLISHFNKYGVYTYSGSLTTPPCTEGVSWFISTEPLWINVQQSQAVKKVIRYNARYTQNNLGEPNLLVVAAKAFDCNVSSSMWS